MGLVMLGKNCDPGPSLQLHALAQVVWTHVGQGRIALCCVGPRPLTAKQHVLLSPDMPLHSVGSLRARVVSDVLLRLLCNPCFILVRSGLKLIAFHIALSISPCLSMCRSSTIRTPSFHSIVSLFLRLDVLSEAW